MTNLLFLTTAETDLLTLSSVLDETDRDVEVTARNILELDNPVEFMRNQLETTDATLLRVVGGAEYLEGDLEALKSEIESHEVKTVAVSASGSRDDRLLELCTVQPSFVESVDRALRQGGNENFKQILHAMTTDQSEDLTVHTPPQVNAKFDGEADLALLYYRANALSGDDDFVDDIRDVFEEQGLRIKPISVPGITRDEAMETVREKYLTDEDGSPAVDGVISLLGFARRSGEEVPPLLEELNVPWFQPIVASRTRDDWSKSSEGLKPSDLSMKVIFPELDGRLTGPPVAFKGEEQQDPNLGTTVRQTEGYDPGIQRCSRWVNRWVNLRKKANEEKKVAVILGNHPTSRARIGNGVGLDTPASLVNLLRTLSQAGYRTGTLPDDSKSFMDHLVDRRSYAEDGRPPEEPAGYVDGEQYRKWLEELPARNRDELRENWDDPSTSERFTGGFSIPGLQMRNVFVGIQPPRGFEEQSGAVYHDPELAPPHLYVAFYRWVNRVFEADAVVHLGKHGTLEWLPGRSVALGEGDWPQLLLESCPVLYPFIINDPGEGTQAKRRTGAVIVDHMVAPQRRTDLPEHLAGLVEAVETEDAEATRSEMEEYGIGDDCDFGTLADEEILERASEAVESIQNSDTRSGLHVLGELPEGQKRVDLLESLWPEDTTIPEKETLVNHLAGIESPDEPRLRTLLRDLGEIKQELLGVLAGLGGQFVQPGPSGAPTDGRPDLLPTGRNFYSRDARGMPTREAWDVGRTLAEELIERHRSENNTYPESVGLVLWGTANMRTGGEDVAQVLALMGVRPRWTSSGRVDGVEVIPEGDLDRPRIDPLVRISGFFRDAFPNLLELIQTGVREATDAPSTRYPNFLVEHDKGIGETHPRIFGSKPENYGAGLLPLIESGNWRGDEDLAEAFLEWGKYAYSDGTDASERRELLENRLADVDAVTQNRDNREHDLFDSDDYFQFHGGMIAASRSLSGETPDAYVSDTSSNQVTVRTLAEESERVFHSRVSHPVWQEGMRDHGYKGGFEMAATVDYVFGYDATTDCVPDSFYERMAEDFVLDETNRSFLDEHNPHAVKDIGERLLEAADRGLWEDPSAETQSALQSALRETETTRESTTSKAGVNS